MRVDKEKLIQFARELVSLSKAHQYVYLAAVLNSPICRGAGDIAKIARMCCVSRHTVSRALQAISRRPILSRSVIVTEWKRNG